MFKMTTLNIILWKCGGPRYRTRGGKVATVTESNIDARGHLWQGRLDDGSWCEWNKDGTHRDGDTSLDLLGPAESVDEHGLASNRPK